MFDFFLGVITRLCQGAILFIALGNVFIGHITPDIDMVYAEIGMIVTLYLLENKKLSPFFH